MFLCDGATAYNKLIEVKNCQKIVLNNHNVISFAFSYAVAKLSGLEPMGNYFKPFTSYGLIIAISVVAIIIQTVIVLIYARKKGGHSE